MYLLDTNACIRILNDYLPHWSAVCKPLPQIRYFSVQLFKQN